MRERTKNASNEPSQEPKTVATLRTGKYFASVKMRELNGCKQELRGVFEYAHYTTMTLHGKETYAWRGTLCMGHREPLRHLLYSTLILDVLFYAKKITSIQNKRSPKTDTMCIILINTRFTATL